MFALFIWPFAGGMVCPFGSYLVPYVVWTLGTLRVHTHMNSSVLSPPPYSSVLAPVQSHSWCRDFCICLYPPQKVMAYAKVSTPFLCLPAGFGLGLTWSCLVHFELMLYRMRTESPSESRFSSLNLKKPLRLWSNFLVFIINPKDQRVGFSQESWGLSLDSPRRVSDLETWKKWEGQQGPEFRSLGGGEGPEVF